MTSDVQPETRSPEQILADKVRALIARLLITDKPVLWKYDGTGKRLQAPLAGGFVMLEFVPGIQGIEPEHIFTVLDHGARSIMESVSATRHSPLHSLYETLSHLWKKAQRSSSGGPEVLDRMLEALN